MKRTSKSRLDNALDQARRAVDSAEIAILCLRRVFEILVGLSFPAADEKERHLT